MDVQRSVQNKPWYRKYWYVFPLLVFSVAVTAYSYSQKNTSFSAIADNLAIGEVQQGTFTVSVRGTGTLAPRETRWVAAQVGGRVESIHAMPGRHLQPGEIILQLSNPDLKQEAEEIAWELEALRAENNALKVTLESQLLDGEALLLNAKMLYESAKINLDAQKKLLEEGNATVSLIEHQRSVLETEQYLVRSNIEEKRLQKLKETSAAQVAASEARYNRLNNSYLRALQQVEYLNVKATLDGTVSAF